MKFTPKGIIVPIITPVTTDGRFNEKVYRDLIDHLASNGVHGVFPFGTTGEFYAFSNDEYRRILDVTMDAVAGRMRVYAGANHITTRGVIEIARIAEDIGADALSVLTPLFISQTQDELYEFYRTIASETRLPIIVYNNRPKTNVHVTPATIARLAMIDNIMGVKDSTGDMTNTEEYIRLTRDRQDFHVLMGRDTLIYAALCYGASGAIASCANVAPRLAVDIYEKFQSGDSAGALEAQFKLSVLRIASELGTFPVVIKESLQMLGFDVGMCMPPIQPLSDERRAELKRALQQIELLHDA